MARSGTQVKTYFESKIFVSPPASVITITPVTVGVGTLNAYDGVTSTTATSYTCLATPYNFVSNDVSFQTFGEPSDGVMNVCVPTSATVEPRYLVRIDADSRTFEILTIKRYPYNSINLCNIITIKELL